MGKKEPRFQAKDETSGPHGGSDVTFHFLVWTKRGLEYPAWGGWAEGPQSLQEQVCESSEFIFAPSRLLFHSTVLCVAAGDPAISSGFHGGGRGGMSVICHPWSHCPSGVVVESGAGVHSPEDNDLSNRLLTSLRARYPVRPRHFIILWWNRHKSHFPFPVDGSDALSTFTLLCTHPRHPSSGLSSSRKMEILHSLNNNP